MSFVFTWDPRKAERNFAKHGVTFAEAATAFADPLARIFDDLEHARQENREILIGHSSRQKLLVVSFLERDREVRREIRLISAGWQPLMKSATMKKAAKSEDDLRAEYRFDYSTARPNRFAEEMSAGTVAVVLEPDVAAVFRSSEAVNRLLRSVISALPEHAEAQPPRKRRAG